MKSLFIAGILLGLFAWIHTSKINTEISTNNMGQDLIADTLPSKNSTQIKKRPDTELNKKLQFEDATITRKSGDSFFRLKTPDTPLSK